MRVLMIRLTAVLAVATGSLLTTNASASEDCDIPSTVTALIESSMQGNKSVTFHIEGDRIAILVTKIDECTVEGRNQEFGRIVIRLDKVDALAQP